MVCVCTYKMYNKLYNITTRFMVQLVVQQLHSTSKLMEFVPDTVMMMLVVCTGVTMLLTLSVLQLVVNDTLPTTSDAVPFIGKSD